MSPGSSDHILAYICSILSTCSAQRMPKSNGATINIDLLGIKCQFLAAINVLRCKRLHKWRDHYIAKKKIEVTIFYMEKKQLRTITSLISNKLISLRSRPADFTAAGIANAGPTPITAGSTPTAAKLLQSLKWDAKITKQNWTRSCTKFKLVNCILQYKCRATYSSTSNVSLWYKEVLFLDHYCVPEDAKNGKTLLHSHSSLHEEHSCSTITDLTRIPWN